MNINDFVSNISRHGLQQGHRYSVRIYPSLNGSRIWTSCFRPDFSTYSDFYETLDQRVTKVSIPEVNFSTNTNKSRGIDYETPYQRNYNQNFTMSLLSDKNQKLKRFFERWMNAIHNPKLGRFEYADAYAWKIQVDLLNEVNDTQKPNEVYEFVGAFPKSVSGFEFDGSQSNNLTTFDVTFSYYYMSPIRETSMDGDVSLLDMQDDKGVSSRLPTT